MPLPLNKRVKARAAEVIEEEDVYASDDSSPSVMETGDIGNNEILSSGNEDEDDAHDDTDEDAQAKLSSISFGTLARAQDSLSRKRKRDTDKSGTSDDKLDALRTRLRELRQEKGLNESDGKNAKNSLNSSGKANRRNRDTENDDDDDDDDDNEEDQDGSNSDQEQGGRKSRSSKHAPGSMSSKRQVTRKRTVVDAPKRHVRDPRFGPVGGAMDETKIEKNYAFLNDYQESEMSELRAAIRKTRDEEDKDILKRKLLSMESKKKSREGKERQQQVLREHRKKEKEAINQGKNPFYLKTADQKQLALVDKYNSMKSRDREKLMDRRRKKVAGREKKNMPQARRMVG